MKKFALLLLFIASYTLYAQTGKKQITLEDIWTSGKFASQSLGEVHWLPGDSVLSIVETDRATGSRGVFLYSISQDAKRLVVSSAALGQKSQELAGGFSSYHWSPDGRSILFVSDPPQQRYLSRLTPDGNYVLYDTASHTAKQLTSDRLPHYYGKISPDGSKLGYVKENDLYVIDLKSGKETRLTKDGSDVIINGKGDWEYEEEMDLNDAWRWSPDGKKIAFWRFDISRVPTYTITEWDSVHPTLITMRYPKAGDPIGAVKTGVITLATGRTVWIDLGPNADQYVPCMEWTQEPNVLVLQRLNREQNTNELLRADALTGATRVILTEKSDTWIERRGLVPFLKNGDFIWASDRDGFPHLYLFAKDGTLKRQITEGKYEVTDFFGVDEASETVYYATNEPAVGGRSIYACRIDGTGKKRLTPEEGTHKPDFAPGFRYFLDAWSTVSQPAKIRLFDNKGTLVRMMVENPVSALQEYGIGTTRFLSFTTSDGVTLNASLLVPDDFDPAKKYPVIINTYGGPGSQTALDKWGGANELVHSYFAAHGYLVFKVDNRGTGGRGRDFMKSVYKNLGTWEVGDQIEAANYLATLPYVDGKRIGIWGWSYGGYTTSMAMMKGADVFKAGVAVAPVTSWRYYDAPYTERFMNTPANNPQGYDKSSPITMTDNLKGRFLVVHGTSDDNVHFQNSANLVKALQKSNKQFSTMFYPDKNHSILGAGTRLHLFTMIANFFFENL
ncbi:MAG: DPP IV N-terminal domain-containing protein [Acidobacteriota bacterium]